MPGVSVQSHDATRARRTGRRPLLFGLLNNATGTAFDRVTDRFRAFLERGAPDRAIRLEVVTLASVRRAASERPRQVWTHFEENRFDGFIVTGAEPIAIELREEAFWPELDRFFGWAEMTGTPLVLSCLASHAAMLRNDGIRRIRLADKCAGVFEEECLSDTGLLASVPARLAMPHSRLNALDEAALRSCGHTILTRSAAGGVGTFTCGRTGWLHFQGHPEYGPTTLLREYRRDVTRFLRGECCTYPLPPSDCLDAGTLHELDRFAALALAGGCPLQVEALPLLAPAFTGPPRWYEPTSRILANWIDRLDGAPDIPVPVQATRLGHHGPSVPCPA